MKLAVCAPCVVNLPPDFLKGLCSPHQANDEKRYGLYKMFWRLLSDVGFMERWEYLSHK